MPPINAIHQGVYSTASNNTMLPNTSSNTNAVFPSFSDGSKTYYELFLITGLEFLLDI